MTTTKTTTCNPSAEFLYQMAQEFGYGAHAIYSPSGSKMWAYCSGSLIPNLFADNENSYESSEGTVAHWVSERWLKTGKRPDHLIGLIIPMFSETHLFQIEVTHDMLDSVEIYVSACFEEQKNAEIMLVEEHVSLGDLPPKLWHDGEWHEFPPQGGTIDNLIVKSGKLIITDLKYGVGVPVSADHNFQLMLYAYGAYLRYGIKYKIDRVVLRIAQVRLGPVQSFEMPMLYANTMVQKQLDTGVSIPRTFRSICISNVLLNAHFSTDGSRSNSRYSFGGFGDSNIFHWNISGSSLWLS